MNMNRSSITPPDLHGANDPSSHHQSDAPGVSGSSLGLTKAWMNSLDGIHIRTHLKNTLIQIFGDDGCEQWQVKQLFEKYELKDL